MTSPDVAAAVAESRARCGLPPKIVDPATLRRLADLFLVSNGVAASQKTKSKARAA